MRVDCAPLTPLVLMMRGLGIAELRCRMMRRARDACAVIAVRSGFEGI
jgi:hypothetical protein